MIALSQKFNFTTVIARVANGEDYSQNSVGFASFNAILVKDTLSDESSIRSIHSVAFANFRFAVVTNLPNVMDSFAVFLLPFDFPTWLAIGICAVAVTVVMTISNRNGAILAISHFIRVISLLLGQSGGNLLHLFKSRLVAAFLLTGWFWSCYILMFNLYQGSILSHLAVPMPPRVPQSMDELLISNLPVLTRSTLFSRSTTTSSSWIVESHLIREVTASFSAKFGALLDRVLFIDRDDITTLNISRVISNSEDIRTRHSNNSVLRTAHRFAVMDTKEVISVLGELIGIFGQKFITVGREETPFRTIIVDHLSPNFVSEFMSISFNSLIEAGISARWESLSELRHVASFMWEHGGETSAKFVRNKMANAKTSVVFYEAVPVSMKVVKFVFYLCAGIMGVSGIVFLWEGRNMYGNYLIDRFIKKFQKNIIARHILNIYYFEMNQMNEYLLNTYYSYLLGWNVR